MAKPLETQSEYYNNQHKQVMLAYENLSVFMPALTEIFLGGFGKSNDVVQKGMSDFVTPYDKQIEKVFRKWVKDTYPTHFVYGEEQGGELSEMPEWLWSIDPIDGTTNYLSGSPDASIVISLRYNGEPVLAQCTLPKHNQERGKIYVAIAENSMRVDGKILSPSQETHLDRVPAIISHINHLERVQIMIGDIWDKVGGIQMNMSSVYESCRVATGESGLAVLYGLGPHEWPAVYLFAKESGCIFGNLGKPDEPFDVSGFDYKSILIAANISIYDQTKRLVHLPPSQKDFENNQHQYGTK